MQPSASDPNAGDAGNAAASNQLDLDPIAARFRAYYERHCPFREDRALAEELTAEAQPVIDAISCASAAAMPFLAHHEGLAMLRLLGRRAGQLGTTPTAALSLVPALLDACKERAAAALPPECTDSLQATCVEGYVSGREDRLHDEAAQRAASAQPIIRIAPRCVLLSLAGSHSPESIAKIVDRFGTELLRADAAAAVVDLTRLEEPTREVAVEVFGTDDAARTLGVRCLFVGAAPWIATLTGSRIDPAVLEQATDLQTALKEALSSAGLTLRPSNRLPDTIRRWLGR